eukprot:GHVL01024076.1.p1 GENE.GHVL01024076.1~~GHVL01024076.1.p1  ORF type:complete len:365 (+),score=40.56 GHVL01024076.1:138-1232(+)
MTAEERYVFDVDWFDKAGGEIVRKYQLTFYPGDSSVEMYDKKNRRIFLKRMEYPQCKLDQLQIGNTITVVARQLKITDYADAFTRKALESCHSRTNFVIKPDAYNHIGKIILDIAAAGLSVTKVRMFKMNEDDAASFLKMASLPLDPVVVAFLSSDVVVGVQAVGDNALIKSETVAGLIRAKYGSDPDIKNAIYTSANPSSVQTEGDFIFGRSWPTTAVLNNCTCCVIRPEAMVNCGGIIDMILDDGFEISAIETRTLDKSAATDFLEVYKTILPEYHTIVENLIVGPCLMMEIRQEDAVTSFRKLTGPYDPEIARHLRPNTLRAKFGIDRIRNAVHCTDLPDDGVLECEYFFSLLPYKDRQFS